MRRRRGYFFAAFLSAAITFGLLTAFVNPKYSGMRYGHHWGWHHRGYYPPYPYYNYPPPAYWNDSLRNAPQDWQQQQQ